MALYRQPQRDGSARMPRSIDNASLEFTKSSFRHGNQMKHSRSVPEDIESDSKSVQVPSLLADDSSTASSINNHEDRPEIDDCGHWVPNEDGNTDVLKRSWSQMSIEGPQFSRTPMDLNTLPGPQACNPQHVPGISDIGAETINHEQDPRIKPPWQKLVSSAGPMPTSSNDSESKTLIRQSTLDSDPSDSDSDSEEDSDDDDISNDEWSGANDNIEAALYQAVYPNIDLAAHLIQTMYPMLVLSYTKKITRKVSSWQEKNIATCGTDAGTASSASTTKGTSPKATSSTGNGSNSKRDRQSSSSDDSINNDEDDDADELGRKRPKKQSDSEPGVPKQRLACPFWKKDPMKYSAAESGRKSCSGPGWFTMPQLKEHLQRAHRPVQCPRCYLIFPFKTGDRSSAVSKLARHVQQDDSCPRKPDSLKEGINEAEWTRISEDKKKKRKKGKGKQQATATEQPQSVLEQWFEIWVILFPTIARPRTPWYPPSQQYGLPHNEHFLDVSRKVNEFWLSEIKAAMSEKTDDDILTLLLECDQQKYSVYRSTFMAISDTATNSFSNLDESDPHSSSTSGSWLRVPKSVDRPQQFSSQASTMPKINFTNQTGHTELIGTSNPEEVAMDARKINMDSNPQTLASSVTYAPQNPQAPPPPQLPPRTNTTPLFQDLAVNSQNNHSTRADMSMDGNIQNIPQNGAYTADSQGGYSFNASEYTPTNQGSYTNESIWSPDVYDMQALGDLEIAAYQTGLPTLQGHPWGDHYPTAGSRQFRGAP